MQSATTDYDGDCDECMQDPKHGIQKHERAHTHMPIDQLSWQLMYRFFLFVCLLLAPALRSDLDGWMDRKVDSSMGK